MSGLRRGLLTMFRHRGMRFALALALLALILRVIDRGMLLRHLSSLNPWAATAMVGVNLLLLLLCSWRWLLIGSAAGFRAPWHSFIRSTWLSWAAAECGPALIVGEWARFQVMRNRAAPLQLAMSQFVDRLSGYAGLILLALVCIPWQVEFGEARRGVWTALIVAVIGAGFFVMVLLLRRFRTTLGNEPGALDSLAALFTVPWHYLLSLLINVLFAVSFTLAALGLGFPVNGFSVFCLSPLVLLGVGSLPSLISDWGKREVVAVVVLSPLGFSPEQSLAVSIVYGGIHTVSALPGLLLLLHRESGSGGR